MKVKAQHSTSSVLCVCVCALYVCVCSVCMCVCVVCGLLAKAALCA